MGYVSSQEGNGYEAKSFKLIFLYHKFPGKKK